jgi:signal transduction histidine kinase
MTRITKSVRFRLTLWYSAVFTFLILVLALALYYFVDTRLKRQLRDEMERDFVTIRQIILEEPGELTESGSEMPALMFRIMAGGRARLESDQWALAGLDDFAKSVPAGGTLRIFRHNGRYFLFDRKTFRSNDQNWTVDIAGDAEPVRRSMNTLRLFLLVGAPFALLLSLFSGYFLALRLLKPVDSMASKAREITADRLDQRLPVVRPDDEFGRLAAVFNQTLERLQSSFESLRRFTSDASHELRSPLTAMRSVGEVALRRPLDEAGYRDAIGSMLEEVGRLSEQIGRASCRERVSCDV